MKVKLSVVKSNCRSHHHKKGDTYIVEDLCPPICHELWHVAYPNIYALINGGTLDHGENKEKRFEIMCPDQGRVVLRGEVIEE